MVCINTGDLLKCEEKLIVHQVNCLGIMGGGVALQIKKKYPDCYAKYRGICESAPPKKLLGWAYIYESNERIIANVFGQAGLASHTRATLYSMLASGLKEVFEYASTRGIHTIAMPYKIGCGLGGGDWNIVFELIRELSSLYEVNVNLYSI